MDITGLQTPVSLWLGEKGSERGGGVRAVSAVGEQSASCSPPGMG